MKFAATLAVATLIALPSAPARADSPAAGTWRMTDGKVTVRISECGAGLCGTIVGLKKPNDSHGRPKRDKENPNPALRNRQVIGLTILSNMKPNGSNSWKGTIYNPDDGRTYSSRMKLQGDSTMKVEGCVASVLCKSMKFTRIR